MCYFPVLFLNEGPLSCWESFRGLLSLHWPRAALLVFDVSILRGSLRKRRVRFTGLTVGVHLRVMLCWHGWSWINLCREIRSFNTALAVLMHMHFKVRVDSVFRIIYKIWQYPQITQIIPTDGKDAICRDTGMNHEHFLFSEKKKSANL